MISFIAEYGFFLLKVLTIAVAIVFPILMIISSAKSQPSDEKGSLVIKNLSEKLERMGNQLSGSQLNSKEYKKFSKSLDKKEKKKQKKDSDVEQSVYVLNFVGDVQATEVDKLKHEINAILISKTKCKEVVLKVESGGGAAYAYGLCAAELQRLVDNKIELTVCIDRVAASGGYLMSCVATKIIAAPWAIVGSIGVIAQMPNIHRLLKKNDVDFEMHTAGEFKRTLTVLGENTEEGRKKFKTELEDLHLIFKDFVKDNRPQIDTGIVATGEVWQGKKAVEVGLIDEIGTSDDYLLKLTEKHKLFEIDYVEKKNITEKFGLGLQSTLDSLLNKVYDLINREKFNR
jgi:serine protease SohB